MDVLYVARPVPSPSNLEISLNFVILCDRVDDSCRKMTGNGWGKRGLPDFRDLGHSLSNAVTDKVLHRPKTRMPRLCRRGIAGTGRDQSNWHPAYGPLGSPLFL